jgi:hypothetical protein
VCFFWLLFFAQAKKSDPRPQGVEASKKNKPTQKTKPKNQKTNYGAPTTLNT